MKDSQKSKEREHEHAVVICSIIGRKSSNTQPTSHRNKLINFIYNGFLFSGGYYSFSHDNHVVYEKIPKRIVDEIIKKIKERQLSKDKLDYDPLEGWEKRMNNNGKMVWTRTHFPVGDYDPNKKTIILYEKNIEQLCTEKKGWNKNKIIHKTYIHEISHAYFNSTKHKYIREIEKAMAELYTLICLDSLKSDNAAFWEPIFEDALEDIKDMQKVAGWSAIYGFGSYLYDNLNEEERYSLIEEFKNNINKINENDQDVKEYKQFILYPEFMGYQQKCMTLLQQILRQS